MKLSIVDLKRSRATWDDPFFFPLFDVFSLLSSALNGSRKLTIFKGSFVSLSAENFVFWKPHNSHFWNCFYNDNDDDDAVKMHFRPSLSLVSRDFCVRAIPVYVDGEIFVGDCERLNLVECHMGMQREKCDDGNASRVNQRDEKSDDRRQYRRICFFRWDWAGNNYEWSELECIQDAVINVICTKSFCREWKLQSPGTAIKCRLIFSINVRGWFSQWRQSKDSESC